MVTKPLGTVSVQSIGTIPLLQQQSNNILGKKSFTNSPAYFSYSKLLSSNATLGCQVSLGVVIITKYIYICASVNKFNDVG